MPRSTAARARCAADRAGPGGPVLADEPAGQVRAGYPRLEPVEEVIASINAVTHDDIRAVAADILTRPKALAVVGPFDDASAFGV